MMAVAAKDIAGKVLGIFFPIMAFVVLARRAAGDCAATRPVDGFTTPDYHLPLNLEAGRQEMRRPQETPVDTTLLRNGLELAVLRAQDRRTGGPVRRLRPVDVGRLIKYYCWLKGRDGQSAVPTVTSTVLAASTRSEESQVRRCLAKCGCVGTPRVGYAVEEVLAGIERALALDIRHEAVVVGSGPLAKAVISRPELGSCGIHVTAVFDRSPRQTARLHDRYPVQSTRNLKSFIASSGTEIAALCVEPERAQSMSDRCVEAGVRAVWNFSPIHVSVEAGVLLLENHLYADGALMSHYLGTGRAKRMGRDGGRPGNEG
jgi:redox-sensing transcriptional repressor